MGRRRAVVEHMAEMAAAAAAMHFGAHHPEASIGRSLDCALDRVIEARPAGAAVEFLFGDEKFLAATGAHEGAAALLVIERATARRLGAVLAHHGVLFRGENASPLRVAMGDRVLLDWHW